ncbi:MAG: hypothetical protein ACIAQF_07055 [Phycisphaerales bacterium JB065]
MSKRSRASKGRGPTRRERREAEARARQKNRQISRSQASSTLSKRRQRAAENLARQAAGLTERTRRRPAWMMFFERVRKQRMIQLAALAMVAILTLMIGVGWWLATHPPHWWQETDAKSAQVRQTSRAVENWAVSTMTRAHPDGEPWAVTLTEEDANAWLAVRLPMWVESERGVWPEGIRSVRVRFHDGRIILGADIREPGDDQPRIVAAAFRLRIEENGKSSLDIDWTQINRLKLPGSVGVNRLSEWLNSAGEEEIADQLASLIRGELESDTLGWKLEDGRRVTVHALSIEAGEVRLVCSTNSALVDATP